MPHAKDFPFYSEGYSVFSQSADDPGILAGSPALGCLGYMQDFPYPFATSTQLYGPIQEHPFRRPFNTTWDTGSDVYSVDYQYLPLHKSCVGISDTNLWYTPLVSCHQDHRLLSFNPVTGGGFYISNLRSSFCIGRRPTPLLMFRADPASLISSFNPIFGVGVLVDHSTIPGALISTYYLMSPGLDFFPIPITDPWSYLDSTSGFVLTSATSGTLTVTF